MDHLVHFEIHADDPARAIAFYTTLFGWTVAQMGAEPYWLVTATTEGEPGISGAILPRRGPRPAPDAPVNGMVNTVQVDDVDAALRRARELGGDVALERMEIPNVGAVAYVHDTEGNVVGLFQPGG